MYHHQLTWHALWNYAFSSQVWCHNYGVDPHITGSHSDVASTVILCNYHAICFKCQLIFMNYYHPLIPSAFDVTKSHSKNSVSEVQSSVTANMVCNMCLHQ